MTTATAVAESGTSAGSVTLDHLSWSSISLYRECPRRFYYHYIEKVPPEFVAATLALGAGFHSAAEAIFQAQLEAEDVPTLEVLLTIFDKHFYEETKKAPEIRYSKGNDETTIYALAEKMLNAYREYVVANAEQHSLIIAIEQAYRFELIEGLPPFEMRLDLLELHRNGELVITDIKTSKCRYNEKDIQEALPQIVLYAHAVMPILRELAAEKIVPRLAIITKAKTPVVQILEPKATQADVEMLKSQVAETWDAIQAGNFDKHESWQCAHCEYRRHCLGY